MRWIILLSIVLSINAYADSFKETIFGYLESSAEVPMSTTLITMIPIIATKYSDHAKMVIESKPDAASYIASDGEINSAYLEQALIIIRKEYQNASDMELAKAILAY